MGLLAWIQKQFGIPINMNNDSVQGSTSEKRGEFKVLRIQPTPNPDAFQFILNSKIMREAQKLLTPLMMELRIRWPKPCLVFLVCKVFLSKKTLSL